MILPVIRESRVLMYDCARKNRVGDNYNFLTPPLDTLSRYFKLYIKQIRKDQHHEHMA